MSGEGDPAMDILADVLEAPAARQAELLDRACGGDAALRAEVERLLGLRQKVGGFMESLDLTGEALAGIEKAVGVRHEDSLYFGRYRALRLIGEGGMGSVYEAQQSQPRRRVAVKVVKPGMDTKQVLARFDAEREALALMDHPHIARVLDAGMTDAGRPFFVMELVNGVPITRYCDANGLPVRGRLDLFIAVCRAVQHAHQKGVIHRDLKPSNVLVATAEGKPVPKVIDFGIAKATAGQRLTEQTLLTECRELVGTPQYMSPEQAGLTRVDADTRSDVYSLGVLLYELLTGTTPFDPEQFRGSSPEEVRRLIRETEPPKPSTRLSRLTSESREAGKPEASSRRTDPATLARAVRGELDWIVMKCLEKDRTRRYETPNELAADVERYLRSDPVHAGPRSTAYWVRKFIRRNRAAMAVAASMAALLVAGIAGTTAGMLRAKAAQGESAAAAAHARREAEQVASLNQFLLDMFNAARPEAGGGRDVKVAELLDRASRRLPQKFHNQPEAEITARRTLGETYGYLGLREGVIENYSIAYGLARKHLGEEAELTLRLGAYLAQWTLQDAPTRAQRDEGHALVHKLHEAAVQTLGEAHPTTHYAAQMLGYALHINGDYAGAERIYRRMLQVQQQSPAAAGIMGEGTPFHGLGWALCAQGKLEDAEKFQREALRVELAGGDDSPRQHLMNRRVLGMILAGRGKLEEAAETLRQAVELEPRLGHKLPTLERTSQDYLNVLVRLKHYPRAVEFARRRLDRATADSPIDHALVAQRTASLVRVLSLEGLHDEAERYRAAYRAALAAVVREPAETYPALVRRALAHANLGHFKQAADDYGLCIALDPSEFDAWHVRGCLLALLAEREAYETHCREMLLRFGQSAAPFLARRTARVCLLLPRSTDECRAIMPIVDATPESEQAPSLAWFQAVVRGLGAYRTGQFEQATRWLSHARDSRPPSPAARATTELLLAMSHHRLGRAVDARAAFDRGRQIISTELASPGAADLTGVELPNWLICRVLYREAQALIPPEAPVTQPAG